MAPPLRAAPRRSTTTGGSALFSSSTSSKESIREAFNLRQFAVSHEPDIAFLLQFRPPSSSSSQTEHTTGFLMFVRTSDAISFLLVRPNHQILLRPEPSAMDVPVVVSLDLDLQIISWLDSVYAEPYQNQQEQRSSADPPPVGPRPVFSSGAANARAARSSRRRHRSDPAQDSADPPPVGPRPVFSSGAANARAARSSRRRHRSDPAQDSAAFASSRIGSRSGDVRYDKSSGCFSASFNRYEDMFDEDDASKVTLPAWPGQGYGRH
nr:uncharacterized protein LOC127314077 isoform X2 [Lolium perenne]